MRDLEQMLRMARARFTALRSMADRNEETEKDIEGLEELDRTALKEVIFCLVRCSH